MHSANWSVFGHLQFQSACTKKEIPTLWMPSCCNSKLSTSWNKEVKQKLKKRMAQIFLFKWQSTGSKQGTQAAAQVGASWSRISMLPTLLESSISARVVLEWSEGSWAAGGPSSLSMFWPSLTHLCNLHLSSTVSCVKSFNRSFLETQAQALCIKFT